MQDRWTDGVLEKGETQVLVVEDDCTLSGLLESYLRQESYKVTCSGSAPDATELLRSGKFDLVLLDLALPPSNKVSEGLALLEACTRIDPLMKVIIISGEGTVRTAMDCIRHGAEDYLVKPIDMAKLPIILERAMQRQRLEQRMAAFQEERLEKARFGKLIGQSLWMKKLFARIREAAECDANVLIQGESGTGKGLVAETIHDLSRRRSQRFVKVNCTAIAEGLLETELFGHRKGSFTGAIRDRAGPFEFAKGGTLFLDEIGEIPLRLQPKLLHAVEDKEIQPVGGNCPIRVDVRIIAATNSNLRQLVREGRFRRDLYYRINGIPMSVPPLRTRDRDIPLLADHFLGEMNEHSCKGFSPAAYEKLMMHDWPGNVRELRTVISRALRKAQKGGWIQPYHLEIDPEADDLWTEPEPRSLEESLAQFERMTILGALTRNQGNVTKTAAELSITRSGLHKKMIRLRIRKEEYT